MKYRMTESKLHDIIKESIANVLNEGVGGNDPITKWVYWCYNYHDPREWMQIFDDPKHMMSKFMGIYKSYGSDAVMNRFFVELSVGNQRRLIDYVMNNYNG